MNWIHRLLNPHCDHCIAQDKESKRNPTVELLQRELESERREKERLLEVILEFNSKPEPVYSGTPTEYKPIKSTRFASFNEKKRQLEAQDKIEYEKLQQLRRDSGEEVKGIEELEKEIGISQ